MLMHSLMGYGLELLLSALSWSPHVVVTLCYDSACGWKEFHKWTGVAGRHEDLHLGLPGDFLERLNHCREIFFGHLFCCWGIEDE
ncbi:hypothetical protein AWV63_10010 [Micromonospora rifamycinica]|nr:hypothetical protein AWV63_10010 [Micromonospora rifamycinica]